MYCPFCGVGLDNTPKFCCFCGQDVGFIYEAASTVSRTAGTDACSTPAESPVHQLMRHGDPKERGRNKRKTCSKPKKNSIKTVKISVGIMVKTRHGFKPIRGKTLPIHVKPQWSTDQLLPAACEKLKVFNQDMNDENCVLLYPDGSLIIHIPGTETPFTIEKYKEAIGKPYQRITLYIYLLEDWPEGDGDEEEEVFVRVPPNMSPLPDTVLWTSPECSTPECSQWSTTTSQPSNGQAKSVTRPHQTTTSEDQLTSSDSCITYTDIYAPGIIDSSSSDCEEGEKLPENHSDGLTAADVVSNLSLKLHSRSCSRFNINRANVWDGALRGFKQSTYDPTYTMLVRFSDDVGQIGEALDTGGPTREFLTLLIDTMKTRRIFEGKDNAKYLSFDSKALEDDEYFHVGRMIAVSMVHGGPGPRCLSPNFFLYLVGKVKAIEATIEDIHDDEVRKALLEINNTTSLTELQRLADKHSSMLQTAGCYRFMTSLDDKKRVKDDYIQWYFTYRNHLSIQRFKEGLATLDFLNALEQHPALFMPFMCYSENCVMLWRACFMCSSVHLVAPCVRRRPEH